MARRKSIAEGFETFQAIEAERARKASQRARDMAHKMLQRMGDGEQLFGVSEFIFAATLGKVDEHAKEAETLQAASTLRQGEVVGVAAGQKLEVVGTTTDSPLRMRVDTNFADPSYWTADATLDLTYAIESNWRRTSTQHAHTPVSAINFLHRGVELQSSPLKQSRELVIGAPALMDFVGGADDPLNAMMVATHLAQLARLTHNPVEESR